MKTQYLIILAAAPIGLAVAAVLARPAEPSLTQGTSLTVARAGHQATRVPDGRVLVTGGCAASECSSVLRSAELFEPGAARFAATGRMHEGRVSHTATTLSDGRVMVAGGWTGTSTTASTEFYVPADGEFIAGPTMSVPRMDATATTLESGDLLILGGATHTNRPTAAVDRFSVVTGRLTATTAMGTARVHHASVRLRDGRVLVIGGLVGRNAATSSAEIYDPALNTFKPTASLMHPRCKHAALPLADGRALVLAGSTDCGDRSKLASTEIFDPTTETFVPGPNLMDARYKVASAAVRLADGTVIIAGDASDVEMWKPGMENFVRISDQIGSALAFSSTTVLSNGRVLIAGGYDATITPTARTWQLTVPSLQR